MLLLTLQAGHCSEEVRDQVELISSTPQPVHFPTRTCALYDINLCTLRHQPVQKGAYNKTNYTKLNKTKLRQRPEVVSISELIDSLATIRNQKLNVVE